MRDHLSTLYHEFLEDGYDCVDRVVLNAYFSLGPSGGGFRMWWRELYGSDENLDNNHLTQLSQLEGLGTQNHFVFNADLPKVCTTFSVPARAR